MKITATIITLNEERNIARAIESLRCADEILIIETQDGVDTPMTQSMTAVTDVPLACGPAVTS